MGGTYQLNDFKDRKTEYPTRRKLIHNPNDEENVYTVQRDEGTVIEEGIAFNAQLMNKFDEKISNMFPVSIINGGTGASDGMSALNNLGLTIASGSFTPSLFSDNPNSNNIEYTLEPTYNQDRGYAAGRFLRIYNLCFVTFAMKVFITSTGNIGSERAYITIGDLPYQSTDFYGQALCTAECSSLGNILISEGGLFTILPNSRRISVEQLSGQVASYFQNNNNWAWFRGSGIYQCL